MYVAQIHLPDCREAPGACGGVRLIAVLIDDRLGLLGGDYVCY